MKLRLSKRMFITISVLILIMTGVFYGMQRQSNLEVSVYQGSDLNAKELASLLGVYVWKVDVGLPDDAKRVNLHLEVKEKGKSGIKQFGPGNSAILSPKTTREILIAIIPLEGEISNSEKVRVIINAFGNVSSGIADNPLNKLGIGSDSIPQKASDGTFALIGGYKGDTISSPISETADVLISLKITPQ
jgi:hypothetical protein